MSRGLTVVLAAVLLAVAACGGDGGDGRVKLDGSPRIPDEEGIVDDVSRDSITLAGGGTYAIGDELQSFSAQTMEALPVLQRKGQYVQIGVDGDRLVWISAIGAVVPGREPVVYYTATVKSVADGRVTFNDGTVLRLAAGLEPEVAQGPAVAELDPASGRVQRLRAP